MILLAIIGGFLIGIKLGTKWKNFSKKKEDYKEEVKEQKGPDYYGNTDAW